MITSLSIRHANTGDAPAIAALHAENWRSGYRGILPDAYLDGDIEAERRTAWETWLGSEKLEQTIVLVAESGENLAGFISIVFDEDPDYGALVENLHVSERQRGNGIGRRLMEAAVRELSGHGKASVCLWVFDDNPGAIRFYTRLGGVVDGHGVDEFAGAHAPDTRIGWRNLDELMERLRT